MMAERARRILREVEAAEQAIRAAHAGRTGVFRVTATVPWTQTVLAQAAARFHERYPDIELRVHTARLAPRAFCRDRMVEHISGPLPESIRFGPATHMPASKRADITLIRNRMKLPFEIKCQWHRDVWNAASDQLDAKYSIDVFVMDVSKPATA